MFSPDHHVKLVRRGNAVVLWTWKPAAWLSTPCTWLTENHVRHHVPTTWARSTSRKVAPRMTPMAGWPPASDRESRQRDGLSLISEYPAAPVAWPGWRPPAAPWSCELSAVATVKRDLLSTGASAWWLSSCSAIRPPTCASGPAPAVWATQVTYLVHAGCLTAAISASECHPAIRTIPRGGPTSGGGP